MAVVVSTRFIEELSQSKDPKKFILDGIGDLSKEIIPGKNILVATYVRPERTAGGIIRPTDNLKEDIFQGKVGLIVKIGQDFAEDEDRPEVGEWVVYALGDGLQVTINGVVCRIMDVGRVRMVLSDPNKVL